jgi:hypothetical protein
MKEIAFIQAIRQDNQEGPGWVALLAHPQLQIDKNPRLSEEKSRTVDVDIAASCPLHHV